MDAKQDLQLSRTLLTGRIPLKRVKDSPPLKAKCKFQEGLPCYVGLNLVRSVSINLNKKGSIFSRTLWRAHVSPMFLSIPYGKKCFQCKFLFSRCKLCLRYTAGNFNENPSKRALIEFLRAIRAKAKFCEHFQIGWDHSIPLIDIFVHVTCYPETMLMSRIVKN